MQIHQKRNIMGTIVQWNTKAEDDIENIFFWAYRNVRYFMVDHEKARIFILDE